MKLLLMLLLLPGGCAGLGVIQATGRPVSEAHAGGHDLRVMDIDSPLRARRNVPILSTPEVFAAYVPSHARDNLLIGEHWVFFKLGEAEWFVERLQDPDPPVDGPVTPDQLKPLESLDWNRVVIPHRSTK